jgi:hypothetical protein
VLPLALSGDQWVALAGVIVGAVVGVLVGGAGLVFAYFNGNREREHGATLARSGRLHEQRREAYVEVAKLLEKVRRYVWMVRLGDDAAPAPSLPNDEEWTSMQAVSEVCASPQAGEAVRRANNLSMTLAARVSDLVVKPEGGPEHRKALYAFEKERERALEAIIKAEVLMRDALAGL